MKTLGLALLTIVFFINSSAQNKTYYVSSNGNDNNMGTSVTAAWKTLTKVNAQRFFPGDVIMLEGGVTFTGPLNINKQYSGTANNPITFRSYGTGRATVDAGTGDGIFIQNAAYIQVKNVNVKGSGRYTSKGTGVYAEVDKVANLVPGVVIDSVEAWGFYYGGICVGNTENTIGGFENLRITNCVLHDNGIAGIQTWSTWDNEAGKAAFNHKGLYIGQTKVYNNQGISTYTDNWSGTGILMAGVENGLIEECEAYENGSENGCNTGGPVGIWIANTKNCTIQFCESYNNHAGKSKDGGGFDIDGGSQDCIIQYCYSRDNEGPGYALFEWGNNIPFTNNVIRYNISQNDARRNSYGSIAFWAVSGAHKLTNCAVYNNTIYLNINGIIDGTPSAVQFMGNDMSGLKIWNNIFYTTSSIPMVNSNVGLDTTVAHFLGNNYYNTAGNSTFLFGGTYNSVQAWKNAARGQERSGTLSLGLSVDPKLNNPGGGTTVHTFRGGNLTSISAYQLQDGSPMIDAGINLRTNFRINPGNRDYYNNPLISGSSTDIGAHEVKKIIVPVVPNITPAANAGVDIVINLPVNNTTLNGSDSKDTDGSITKYKWTKINGPDAFNIDKDTLAVTALTNLVEGVYTFRLTVTDNMGATHQDDVRITVLPILVVNKAPVANAGSDITITLPVNNTTLNGSGSKDEDGSIVYYKWTRINGPSTYTIANDTSAVTSLNNLIAGVYHFILTVKDNNGSTHQDSIAVTVHMPTPVNRAPVAHAGKDTTIILPVNSITLNGNTSTDADGTITSYRWTKISGPDAYHIVNENAALTTLNNLKDGIYTIRLQVTDNNGATHQDDVVITVLPAPVVPNKAPVANAGTDVSITLPQNSVSINGAASKDEDGNIVSYKWTKVSGPDSYRITDAQAAITNFTHLTVGVYVLRLQVTDDKNATSEDDVRITVKAAPVVITNQPPVANAGPDVLVNFPKKKATLNGSASKDMDGTIASYKWSMVNGPAQASIDSPNDAITEISKLEAGTYVFALQVTDNNGATHTDSVSVTVRPQQRSDASQQQSLSVDVFPNPSSGIFQIRVNSVMNATVTLKLFDIWGKEIKVLHKLEKNANLIIPDNLEKGTYILVAEQGFQKYTTRLVKL